MNTIRHWGRRASSSMAVYLVADRLHAGRIAKVPSDQIATTVSAWLSELGATSTMADELARAVRTGDWPAAHRLEDFLSVDVTLAA